MILEVSVGEYRARRIVHVIFIDDYQRFAELVQACGLLDDHEFEELDLDQLIGHEIDAALYLEQSDSGKVYVRLRNLRPVTGSQT